MVAIRDAVGSGDGVRGEADRAEIAGVHAIRQKLLPGDVQRVCIGDGRGDAPWNENTGGERVLIREGGGDRLVVQRRLQQDTDAGGLASALGTTVQEIGGGAVDGEVGVDRAVIGARRCVAVGEDELASSLVCGVEIEEVLRDDDGRGAGAGGQAGGGACGLRTVVDVEEGTIGA